MMMIQVDLGWRTSHEGFVLPIQRLSQVEHLLLLLVVHHSLGREGVSRMPCNVLRYWLWVLGTTPMTSHWLKSWVGFRLTTSTYRMLLWAHPTVSSTSMTTWSYEVRFCALPLGWWWWATAADCYSRNCLCLRRFSWMLALAVVDRSTDLAYQVWEISRSVAYQASVSWSYSNRLIPLLAS